MLATGMQQAWTAKDCDLALKVFFEGTGQLVGCMLILGIGQLWTA